MYKEKLRIQESYRKVWAYSLYKIGRRLKVYLHLKFFIHFFYLSL